VPAEQFAILCDRALETGGRLMGVFRELAAEREARRREWPSVGWAIWPTGCAGRCGDADTRRAPVPATTAARRPGTHEDHDLRLED
jgi:hypothetical protein